MNIGLDWDGTVTSDEVAFLAITKLLKAAGHGVHIVTMRYPSESVGITQEWIDLVDGIHFTCRQAKSPFMCNQGVSIDVWIDDNPKAVYQNAAQAFGNSSPEGSIVTTALHPNQD